VSAPFSPLTHYILEKDCAFTMSERPGSVLEIRQEGYVILWDEWIDPETGEVRESDCSMMSHDDVRKGDQFGTLRVVRRPKVSVSFVGGVLRQDRSQDEVRRMILRKAFAVSVEDMIARGDLRDRRADFERNAEAIAHDAKRLDQRWARDRSGLPQTRGMAKTKVVMGELGYTESGRQIFDWYRRWRSAGENGLFDSYRCCGSGSRYTEEERNICEKIIGRRLDEERCSISSIVTSVQAFMRLLNKRRARQISPQGPLAIPGYRYVWSLINEMAPVEHAIRTRGLKVAYKNMHGVGVGVTTSRALERVETDEYTVDLMVLFRDSGILENLLPWQKLQWGLDGGPKRVTISAAIDVHTRCIVAMKIVPEGARHTLRDTVEMIYTNKKPLSDAAGCELSWEQFGKPEEICMDRGPKYTADDAYSLLSSLGVTNMGAPAGLPWLRPFIERIFQTLHKTLLHRLSGRTFSDVVAKGDNDAEARATVTLDEFLPLLVRWIVDMYHTTPHPGLNQTTPQTAWRRAIGDCKLKALSSREMRLVFGTRLTRKAGPHGLLAMHVNYLTKAFEKVALKKRLGFVEFAYWRGDVGAIEVKLGGDTWMTVTAADERWIGKDHIDLEEWLAQRDPIDPVEQAAHDQAVVDIDAISHRKKKLRNMIASSPTPEEFEKLEELFTRHTDTADRRNAAPAKMSLFGDEVVPSHAAAPVSARPETNPETNRDESSDVISVDDLME
jgi:putative transposase